MRKLHQDGLNKPLYPKRYLSSEAVSELMGTILLLLVAVSAFSIVYLGVLSDPGPTPVTNVNISATIEGRNIILEHRGGDPIPIDTKLSYIMNNTAHSFLISDFLENSAKIDGQWNIGERCYIPFEYDLDYLDQYQSVEVSASEDITNSLIFTGTLELHPMSDLGLEVNYEPEILKINDDVTITVHLSCLGGDVGARNVSVQCKLSPGLAYNWNTTTSGSYSDETGIWTVDKLMIGETETLVVNASVIPIDYRPFTQLAVILDGSASISSGDWEKMREGLSNSVKDADIFPHDGSTELTVIQFGGYISTGGYRAESEIDQKIITNNSGDPGYYATIASSIENIVQLGGATPTSCGIRLAADRIHDSPMFNEMNRTVFILVTDGKANCEWIQGGYTGSWDGNGWIQSTYYTKSGSGAAQASGEGAEYGDFISKAIDASNTSVITVDFWYRLDDTEAQDSWNDEENDLDLYFYNGVDYDNIISLGGGSENNWLHYQQTITDNQYFNNDFRIMFHSRLTYGENIYIDDVTIDTGDELFVDGFEGDNWNKYWTNPGKISANKQRDYLITLLDMNESQDEFDCLAVGSDTDQYWLNHSIAWPQPGYKAPPYEDGPGWWSYIEGYQDFEVAISNIFQILFQSRITPVKINMLEPVDPNLSNDNYQITIIPTD